MKKLAPNTITLDVFEGSFDFLIHLIQKSEIEATDVSLHKIIEQYLEKQDVDSEFHLDCGAEFIGTAASLLWLKSRSLLPQIEQLQISEETVQDPQFDIIHQLMDYCRFKQAAKELTQLEYKQSAFYPRGSEAIDPKKTLGIEHISLEDLASLFQQILFRAKDHQGNVLDEAWKVSDKISHIQSLFIQNDRIIFYDLFSQEMSRVELIVIFLAILELMKSGELRVINDLVMQQVIILSTKTT